MIIVNRTMNASDKLLARSFIVTHRTVLGVAVAAAAVVIFMMVGSESREVLPFVTAAVPDAPEKFDYFPDLYQNTAKQVEEPIPTF